VSRSYATCSELSIMNKSLRYLTPSFIHIMHDPELLVRDVANTSSLLGSYSPQILADRAEPKGGKRMTATNQWPEFPVGLVERPL
jgi:hypothetical protein